MSLVEQTRAEGQRCDDELLSLTTPLLRRHFNRFGRYRFDLARMRQDAGLLAESSSEPSSSERTDLNGGFGWMWLACAMRLKWLDQE